MIRRLVHCPAAAQELVVLESDFVTLLEMLVNDLLVEIEETLNELFTLLLVNDTKVELLEDFTVLVTREEVLEALVVEDAVVPTLLNLVLAQTNCVCLISYALLMLKDSNTILLIAFRFAPKKELNRTVYV